MATPVLVKFCFCKIKSVGDEDGLGDGTCVGTSVGEIDGDTDGFGETDGVGEGRDVLVGATEILGRLLGCRDGGIDG